MEPQRPTLPPGGQEPSRLQRYLEERFYSPRKARSSAAGLLVPLGLLVAAVGGFFWYATAATVQQCSSSLVYLANQSACATDSQHHSLGEVGFFSGLAAVVVGVVISRRQ